MKPSRIVGTEASALVDELKEMAQRQIASACLAGMSRKNLTKHAVVDYLQAWIKRYNQKAGRGEKRKRS